MRTPRTALAGAMVAGLMLLPAAASAQDDSGTVTVVHAVPGATVDVYVNGDLTLEDFAPETITDPLTLPAGDYEVEIFAADADPAADEAIISGSTTLPAGANASLVAHPDASGTPVLGVFVNDTSEIAAGETRLTVRHTAAAPAVDVRAGGDVIFPDVSNGDEGVVDVPAGDYTADVVLAGTDTVALGPADLTLPEGTNTIVYAYGTAEAGYDLLAQSISGLHSAPEGVPAGDAGLADTSTTAATAALAGLALLSLTGAAIRRRQVRATA